MAVDIPNVQACEVVASHHFERRIPLARMAFAGDDRTSSVLLVLVNQLDLDLLFKSEAGAKIQLYLLLVLNFELKLE